MAEDDDKSPEDELRDMLRDLLSGQGGVDPSRLAGVAGLPSDPTALAAMMAQFQAALQNQGDGIDWKVSTDQATTIATTGATSSSTDERFALEQAFHVASLWLADATNITELTQEPRLLTRAEWVRASMPVWAQLAEPVATSISDALTRVLEEQAPEELQSMIAGASKMLRGIGGTMFAMQLGQVVGQLSTEVVSGGDVGIPLLDDNVAAIIPQNVRAFGEGLELSDDQVHLYLAVRELAHARLFRHARWLRLHLISSITEFARGIRVDTVRLESLAEGFDPSNPEELRAALVDGSLIPPKSESQLATLARLETTLALVEGWVDVITASATRRLPNADAVAETVRRRRATGGPAESAFATLVGLELRPRRLREAAAMWQAVTDAVGPDLRDSLWSHPDLMPVASDIDDPSRLIAALEAKARGEEPELDEMDTALEALLRGEGRGGAGHGDVDGRAVDGGAADGGSPREDPPPHV
ncbi:zinc-dependent metalloprotease [Labedella populi]|uniref:Zinc-dependent metalloprotease n=1 Tax=Labedella populi TaxID=2498850 RepID=A0A444QDI2_9MICO|nr:zinc-dependent metalloprotease [Labedella populi]RWZ64727.1 zinc-dependent metalloprotease [Labedella populi]